MTAQSESWSLPMRRILALPLLLLLFTAPPAAAQQFGAESFRLANGMQVVVIPNHSVPAVTHMVWYRVGAADDPRGK
jgi:zinc protease